MRIRSLSTLLVLVSSAPPGCSDGKPEAAALRPARDVILVTLDTTRFDHTSLADGDASRSPNLDRLAREGVVFERAYAPVPVTLPSHASLLTGRSPQVHGLTMNGTRRLDASIPLVAERLQEAGFETGAFVSSAVLDRQYGLARGFATYDSPPPGRAERRGAETSASAVAWLAERAPSDRIFLWLHLYDPHFPYDPPARFRSSNPYAGEVAAADAALGSVLQVLLDQKRLDDALIVVAADHGEGLGDHGEEEHGILLYEEAIHVPLVVRLPGGFRRGTRTAAVVRLQDLAPTLLARAGLGSLGETEGVDLTPLLSGTGELELTAYAESHVGAEVHGFAPLLVWIDGASKFIQAPSAELYDLATDPQEKQNLVDRDPRRAATLAAALRAEHDRLDAAQVTATEVPADPEQIALMRELGYLGAISEGTGSGMDPKLGIRIHNLIRRANQIANEGRPDEALGLLAQVRERDPGNRTAALFEARFLGAVPARRADARERLTAFLVRDPKFLEGWLLLGELSGDVSPVESARCFEHAVSVAPENFEARYNLARATELSGDFIGAGALYDEALSVARKPSALNALAWMLATCPPPARDPARAKSLANEAVGAEPEQPEYLDTLAEALAATGDPAGAVAAMERAIRASRASRPDFQERLARFQILAASKD